MFSGKSCCGVRVYERDDKFADMYIPPELENKGVVQDWFFSPASHMLADNSIPTVYSGDGVCGIAFGENVKAVSMEAMKCGLIIDLRAAEILAEKGVDTGIEKIGGKYIAGREYYDFLDNQYIVFNEVCDISVKNGAKILSHFAEIDDSENEVRRTPASFLYKNAEGQQFLVFAFYAYPLMTAPCDEGYYRCYMRGAEINYAIEHFGGVLPAYSYGNPDLYIIAKKDGETMSVGLWNIFPDEVIAPVIKLDGEYSEICFAECDGYLEGDRAVLSDIPPYGFAAFEVRK